MNLIDIDFDFRQDSRCDDPDTDSPKLYEAHKLLWSKELPNGKTFTLEIKGGSYGRLLLKNNLCMNLSSDRFGVGTGRTETKSTDNRWTYNFSCS